MQSLKVRSLVALAMVAVLATWAGRLAVQAQVTAPGRLVIHIKSNALGFGSVAVGRSGAPQTITLQNVGGGPLSILSNTALAGTHKSDFGFVNSCPGTLGPQAMCTMTFTFTPTANGARDARLMLYTDVHTYSATGPIEQILPLIGQGLAPGTPQPEVGPLDPRTGYPTYYSDGYNALELCLDNTPPNGPNGLPLPQTYDPVARVWSPTMCLAPAPDADKNRPPSITLNAATTNWGAEGFYWYGGADATPTGWTRALLVLAQEAADEPMLAGQQWMFGRLRLRADGVPPGTYRFTHPFGSDIVSVAVGDDRVFETSDIGCMTTPCDFTLALNSRISRFLQCANAPIVVNGVEYLGDPNQLCLVTNSPLNQNFFRIEQLAAGGTAPNGPWNQIGFTDQFNVSGKKTSTIAPPPPTNLAPDAVDDQGSTPFNTALFLNVLANDTDPNAGDTLIVTSATQPANGSVIFNGGTVTYTPNAGFSGTESFQYTIADSGGLQDTATVTVTVGGGTNHAPTAGNDTFSFTLPRLGSILPAAVAPIPGVLANDTDADGNPLTAVLVAGPAADPLAPGFPQIVLGPEGSIQYADGLGIAQATQPITFTYAANDGQANSNVATVTINLVQPVGQPIAFNDAVTTPQDTLVRIDADSNDSANGAPGTAIRQAAASFIVRRVPVNGTVRALRLNPGVTPQDWGFEYTPNAGFVGVDSFTYTVDDGAANFVSNPATVVVTVSAAGNASPVAVNDSAVTQLNTAVVVAVLANDTDADGDALAVTSVTNVVGGTAVQNANNTVTYTPSLGFSGAGSFTYAISDGRGGSASASAAITVQLGPNTAPVAVNDTATTAFGTAVTVFVLLNDSDPDVTDVLSVSGVSNAVNGTAAINANSTAVIFTPAAGFSGQGSFSYAIADGRGGSASANVTVTVNPAPPVAVPNVVNATQAAASAAITGAGLTVGAITQASSATVPAGSVISSNPAAGTLVAPGSAVALLVSTGPAQVAVPNVVNATQAAASAAITGAGLTVGAITQASSATVPSGSVISSNPAAGTLVAPGSAVALVVSTGAGADPTQVLMVFAQGLGNRSIAVTTTTPGVRLVAFVGADGPQVTPNTQAATVSGGGLTWTRVRQQRARFGVAEIWTANAPAVLTNASITSTLAVGGTGGQTFNQQLTVIGFTNVSAVGAANGASTPGAAAAVASTSLVTLGAGSVVYAVGADWDNTTAHTVGAGQTKVREFVLAGFIASWVQRLNGVTGAAGSTVTLNTTAPTSAQWNMAIIELRR